MSDKVQVFDNSPFAVENEELKDQLRELQERYDQLTCAEEGQLEFVPIEFTPEAIRTMAAMAANPEEFPGADDVPIKGDPFYVHTPSEACRLRLALVRRRFRVLRDYLERVCPPGRERSLAITHLQDSMNHAICGCVIQDPSSVPSA